MEFKVGSLYRAQNDVVMEIKSIGPHYFIATTESGISLSYDKNGDPLSGVEDFKLVELVRPKFNK